MPQFKWESVPPSGACLTCGTQSNDRGFVNGWSEVNITRDGYEITGVADFIICGTCLEQMAALVGSLSKDMSERVAEDHMRLEVELEKSKEREAAWQQRLLSLASLDIKDFAALLKLEEADAASTSSEPKP